MNCLFITLRELKKTLGHSSLLTFLLIVSACNNANAGYCAAGTWLLKIAQTAELQNATSPQYLKEISRLSKIPDQGAQYEQYIRNFFCAEFAGEPTAQNPNGTLNLFIVPSSEQAQLMNTGRSPNLIQIRAPQGFLPISSKRNDCFEVYFAPENKLIGYLKGELGSSNHARPTQVVNYCN